MIVTFEAVPVTKAEGPVAPEFEGAVVVPGFFLVGPSLLGKGLGELGTPAPVWSLVDEPRPANDLVISGLEITTLILGEAEGSRELEPGVEEGVGVDLSPIKSLVTLSFIINTKVKSYTI